MLKPLAASQAPAGWLDVYSADFARRFTALLSFNFRVRFLRGGVYIKRRSLLAYMLIFLAFFCPPQKLSPTLSLSVLLSSAEPKPAPLTLAELRAVLSAFDTRRLHAYAQNMVDYHVIVDLIPARASAVVVL